MQLNLDNLKMSITNMKFLLIGNGFIALRHKQAIESISGEVVGIVDTSQGEDAWKEEIENTDADCIVILTPNDLHFEMAKLAAQSNKIVLSEKPLTISVRDAQELSQYPNIFTVLQLRYHPDIEKIRQNVKDNNEINMDISVYRDKEYYQCWKGQKQRSGGVLFNLGIHYFDLLLHIFGPAKEVKLLSLDDKTGTGIIKGDNYVCNFKVSTDAQKDNQKRVFKINGENYNFSSQDNLSFEDLHKYVYQDLVEGKGILPQEALSSIKLVKQIYESK